jgi:hypothetical protein
MACKCNEKTSVLRCKNCGRIQTISHSNKQNPLEEAKKAGRKCKNCYSEEFVIG